MVVSILFTPSNWKQWQLLTIMFTFPVIRCRVLRWTPRTLLPSGRVVRLNVHTDHPLEVILCHCSPFTGGAILCPALSALSARPLAAAQRSCGSTPPVPHPPSCLWGPCFGRRTDPFPSPVAAELSLFFGARILGDGVPQRLTSGARISVVK